MLVAHLHQGRQVLEVDLVHDAGARGHGAEVLEGALGELEQLVALTVPVILQRHVEGQRTIAAEKVHLHRVIDHQVARHQRVDPVGISLHAHDRVTHRRQVHHTGNASEVLQHDPRWHEGDLTAGRVHRLPRHDVPDMLLRDDAMPGKAKRILQQDTDGEGEPVQSAQPLLFELRQPVDDGVLAVHREGAARTEGIWSGGHRDACAGRGGSTVDRDFEDNTRADTLREREDGT